MNDPIIVAPSAESASLATERKRLDERARSFIDEATSPNTRRAYRADWQDFTTWCEHHHETPLPASPETVTRYIADLAEALKVSTIERRLTSIAVAHRFAKVASPTRSVEVTTAMKGIRRSKAKAGETVTQKEAAVTAIIRAMVRDLTDAPADLRDRALLLLGFAGAFRRSELVALNVRDVKFSREGLVVTVRMSKTDQEGAGQEKGIPYGSNPMTCPVRALEDWLEHAHIKDAPDAPIFRPITRHGKIRDRRLTDRSVALIVKGAALRAGLDADHFAGHSLRSGLATAAARAGVSERAIMNQTGHKSVTVARRYIRRGSLFNDNAAAQVGL